MATGIMKFQENMSLPNEHNKLTVADPKELEIQELSHKVFKIIVLKMLRELQENTKKQIYNIRKTIKNRNAKFNKETENIKKNQTEILKLKNTMTELKNSIESFNSIYNQKKG